MLADLDWFGLLFESLAIRDLRMLSQPLDGEVFHYRDHYGLEVDAIVQLRDGRWAAFEIKLDEGQVEQAARNWLRLANAVDDQRSGPPNCLAVICGKGYAYRVADGARCCR